MRQYIQMFFMDNHQNLEKPIFYTKSYRTFSLCFQYLWMTEVDGVKSVLRPEHNPLVYKDVQIYLGKEMALNTKNKNQMLYMPRANLVNNYVGAAQGSH